ncbi:MAG: hypothetical protein QXL01_00815 [Thermoplasmatales archaeon]
MKNWKRYVLVIAIAVGALYASYWYGKSSNPPETIIKVEEKIREKIVKVEVEKKNKKKNTITKIIEHPDGTKETIITEVSESNSEIVVKDKTETEGQSSTESITKSNILSKYKFGVIVESKILDKEERDNFMYSATAGMRIFGPWWLDGKIGVSEKSLGLGVSLEF